MGRPIYYYELTVTVNTKRDTEVMNTWFICQVEPDKLNMELHNDRKLYEELIIVAKGKKSTQYLKRKVESFKAVIDEWKQVGTSQV